MNEDPKWWKIGKCEVPTCSAAVELSVGNSVVNKDGKLEFYCNRHKKEQQDER